MNISNIKNLLSDLGSGLLDRGSGLVEWVNDRPRWMRWTGGLVLAAAIAWGGWSLIANRPPSPNADPVALAKFAATDKFASLSAEEKKPYLDSMQKQMPRMMEVARSGQLSEEEQHQAFRNAMTARMEQQMTDYFNLPEGKEREKYLDQLIDEQEKRMADHNRDQANRPPGPPPGQANQGNRGGGGGWRDPQRMKDRIENTAPDQRAKRAAFMKDMAARRQARGLPSRGGPGGPGGGGGRGGR